MLPEIPKYKDAWVAFFDILGFKSLIQKSNTESGLYLIVDNYHEILNDLKKRCSYYEGLELNYTWFSDSFMIYSKDGSEQSYAIIQQVFYKINTFVKKVLAIIKQAWYSSRKITHSLNTSNERIVHEQKIRWNIEANKKRPKNVFTRRGKSNWNF